MADLPKAFFDAAGHAHGVAPNKARILSLAPALTDLCFALGIGDKLVGRSEACKTPADQSSASMVAGPGDAPDLAKIEAMAPTHALAHLAETPEPVRAALREKGIELIAVRPARPEDNFELFSLIGGIFSANSEADTLARRFELALARVKMGMRKKSTRRIIYLTGKNPYRTIPAVGYVDTLLALARLEAIGAPAISVDPDPTIEITASLLLSVDKVILSGTPGAFRRSDIRLFAAGHDIARERVILLDSPMAGWYGARAIAAMDELLALREKVDATV